MPSPALSSASTLCSIKLLNPVHSHIVPQQICCALKNPACDYVLICKAQRGAHGSPGLVPGDLGDLLPEGERGDLSGEGDRGDLSPEGDQEIPGLPAHTQSLP